MNSPIIDAFSYMCGVSLTLLPFMVFLGILANNFYIAFIHKHASYLDPNAVFAFLGGFIIFAIGFAILITNPEVKLDLRESLIYVFTIITLGCVAGILFFIGLQSVVTEADYQNWFIFVTNGFMSLSIAVYLLVDGIQDVIIFGTLGFSLGIAIYGVGAGPRKRSTRSNKLTARYRE